MGEFLERLTSGRTILLLAVAVVLVLRLAAASEHDHGSGMPPAQPALVAQP